MFFLLCPFEELTDTGPLASKEALRSRQLLEQGNPHGKRLQNGPLLAFQVRFLANNSGGMFLKRIHGIEIVRPLPAKMLADVP